MLSHSNIITAVVVLVVVMRQVINVLCKAYNTNGKEIKIWNDKESEYELYAMESRDKNKSGYNCISGTGVAFVNKNVSTV